MSRNLAVFALSVGLMLSAAAAWAEETPGVVKTEFIFETAGFRSCHASTLAQTPDGLVAAWFGGTGEGATDVGIWASRQNGEKWSEPVRVATAKNEKGGASPCWNPVLFQVKSGPLLLFYKAGPRPSQWWGELIESSDGGATWSEPRRLPEGFLGPIKNKPVTLSDSQLLCPSSTEHDGWRVHMERTPDLGRTWTKTEPLNDGKQFSAIQPTILRFGKQLQILCRSKQGKIYESWSDDEGKHWSPLAPSSLPNPGSGIDAVTLPDGRALLVYNHRSDGERFPLNVAVSADGKKWQAALTLETMPGEFSYPAVIATADGKAHISYTWNRKKIKHVVIDPAKLVLRDVVDGQWPR
jgi:alpha-L-rhamnosidase